MRIKNAIKSMWFVGVMAACLLTGIMAWAQSGELRIAAAADLTRAFGEMGRVYEQQTGQKTVMIFGASGQLAKQIENGAPYDVFASANEDYVTQLERKNLIVSGTKQTYAQGKLVLWTRKGGPPLPATLADLLQPRYTRIAIANPTSAPYGLLAKQALQSAGVWDRVQAKLVTGENIQQTLQFAVSGNADIAFVSRSLASDGAGVFKPVPDNLYPPLSQTLAVLQSSQQPDQARRFALFVTGRQGQAILKKYGFEAPRVHAR